MATTRFWLKDSVEEKLTKGEDGELMFGKMAVKEDKSGEKYVDVDFDPTDPVANVPALPRNLLKRVSYTCSYYVGFRFDGIYRYKGATARVKTSVTARYENGIEYIQYISISAGSLRTLRQIYSKVRTGDLPPSEKWGMGQPRCGSPFGTKRGRNTIV